MFRIISSTRRAVVFGAIAGLGLTLGACSGDTSSGSSATPSPTSTSSAGNPVSTSTADANAPDSAANSDFCSQAIDSIAASNNMTDATDGLNTTLSDPTIFASGDMTPIHELSQAILDSANVAAGFYAAGAANADDPDVRAAFNGLSTFVDQYSLPVAQAGLDAASMTEYATSVSTMLGDPDIQALLPKAAGWAATVSTYTQQECNITASGDS